MLLWTHAFGFVGLFLLTVYATSELSLLTHIYDKYKQGCKCAIENTEVTHCEDEKITVKKKECSEMRTFECVNL